MNTHRCVQRESRRRNCLTETTRTRHRRKALIKSRSRLRSSSRVTRYCVWPRMAASKISLSSGSRHIFSSPGVCTTLARAAISRTNVSTSPGGYLNRRVNRGRVRTSAISASCESDVTTLKSSRRHLVITCPGGPVGLRKAETQTLVSSRATSGTAFRFDLSPRSSHFSLDDFLWDRFGAGLHSAKQPVEFIPPLPIRIEGNQNLGLLPQSKWLQGPQYPVLIHRPERLFHWTRSSRLSHEWHYRRAFALGSRTSLGRIGL